MDSLNFRVVLESGYLWLQATEYQTLTGLSDTRKFTGFCNTIVSTEVGSFRHSLTQASTCVPRNQFSLSISQVYFPNLALFSGRLFPLSWQAVFSSSECCEKEEDSILIAPTKTPHLASWGPWNLIPGLCNKVTSSEVQGQVSLPSKILWPQEEDMDARQKKHVCYWAHSTELFLLFPLGL